MIWMKERLISRNGGVVLFLLAVLLACLMISSGGADAASENGYEYSVDGTDATITGYTGPGGDITIPSTLGGNAVVEIIWGVFADNDAITSVSIPSSIKELGSGLFENCTELVIVNFLEGSTITEIPGTCFKGCTSLTTINIPSTVTSIGSEYDGYSFEGCTSLETISIPDAVTYMGRGTFKDCSALKTIDIGEDSLLEHIGGKTTFGALVAGCTSLQTFYMPKLIDVPIGESDFEGCTSLLSFSVHPESNRFIAHDGVLCYKDSKEVEGVTTYYPLSIYVYPAGKTDTTYTPPETVKNVASGAFQDSKLVSIDLSATTLETLPPHLFRNCKSLESFEIPITVRTVGYQAFEGCTALQTVTVAEGNEHIKLYSGTLVSGSVVVSCFDQDISTYTISDSGIQAYTFSGFSTLSELKIDFLAEKLYVGIKSYREFTYDMGHTAFDGCNDSLKTIVSAIDGVTLIGIYSDSDLREGISDIKNYKGDVYFLWETEIDGLTYRFTVEDGSIVIKGYEGDATDLVLPTSIAGKDVVAIGDGGVFSNSDLKTVTIPETYVSIGSAAFKGCKSLTTVTIAGEIYDVRSGAFMDCTALVTVSGVIDGPVYERGFEGCISLKDIDLSDISSVGSYAFKNCRSLESITLDVQKINFESFYGCSSLKSVNFVPHTYNDGVYYNISDLGPYSFQNCKSLTSFYIPAGVTNAGNDQTFTGCTSLSAINVSPDNNKYKSINGVLYSKDLMYLNHYPAAKGGDTFLVPSGVKYIRDYSLIGNSNLVTIKIPASVQMIGSWAFTRYTSLLNIDVDENNSYYRDIDGVLFTKDGTSSPILIKYPAGRIAASYDVPDGVLMVGDYSFEDCARIQIINISDSVEYVGICAFNNCTALRTVNLGSSVEGVDSSFYNNPALESVTMVIPVGGRTLMVQPDQIHILGSKDYVKDATGAKTVQILHGPYVADMDYYVLYTVDESFIVEFDANGGVGTMGNQTFQYGVPQDLSANTFTYEGMRFIGWNTSSYGGGIAFFDGQTVSDANLPVYYGVTLYAQWAEPAYYVLTVDDGEYTVSYYYEEGAEILEISAPERQGYTFKGWDTEIPEVMPAKDLIVTAVWEIITIDMTFVFNDGTTPDKVIEQTYGHRYVLPEDPVREGYDFIRWYYVDSEVNVYIDSDEIVDLSEDVTVNAEWCLKEYTVWFLDWDGGVWDASILLHGETIVKPVLDPSMLADDNFTYKFHDWTGFNNGMTVSSDISFFPVFIATPVSVPAPTEGKVEFDVVTDIIDIGGFITDINGMLTNGIPLDIEFDQGSIEMGADAFSAIDTDNSSIGIVPTNGIDVPAEVASKAGDRPVYNVFIGGIHEFDGDLTISFNYVLGEGESAENLCIWHFDDNGNYVVEECTYDSEKKVVTFTTDSLSYFSIMHGTGDPDPGSESDDDGGVNVVLIVGIVVAVIAVIGVGVFFFLRGKS